jgi:hypothetical protein
MIHELHGKVADWPAAICPAGPGDALLIEV